MSHQKHKRLHERIKNKMYQKYNDALAYKSIKVSKISQKKHSLTIKKSYGKKFHPRDKVS